MSPSSHAFSMMSCGHVPSRSYSHATRRISFAAKSCAISRSAFCSSVRVKSTTFLQLLGKSGTTRLTGQSTEGTQGYWRGALRAERDHDGDDPEDQRERGHEGQAVLLREQDRAPRSHGPASELPPHGQTCTSAGRAWDRDLRRRDHRGAGGGRLAGGPRRA